MIKFFILFFIPLFLSFIVIHQKYPEIYQTMVYSKSNFGPRINYEFHTSALTIEQIFSEDHSWTATLSAERKRVIVVTGDVNPARSVNAYAVKTNNYTWP